MYSETNANGYKKKTRLRAVTVNHIHWVAEHDQKCLHMSQVSIVKRCSFIERYLILLIEISLFKLKKYI